MKTSRFALLPLLLLFGATLYSQEVKPPYIYGMDNQRIKSKNFLKGMKKYGSTGDYLVFNDPRGVTITFDKSNNRFDMFNGALSTNRSIRMAKQQLRTAEKTLLRITGISYNDRCRINITVRLIYADQQNRVAGRGGEWWDSLPSCDNC